MLRNHALVIRTRNVIGRNRWFSIALFAGFFLRLLAMIGYPGALWFSGDSYVYIGAALRSAPEASKLAGLAGLVRQLPYPDASKLTGYSLFLRQARAGEARDRGSRGDGGGQGCIGPGQCMPGRGPSRACPVTRSRT